MSAQQDRIARLALLGRLIFDTKLAELHKVAQAREATRAALAALDRPATTEAAAGEEGGLSSVALGQAVIRYQAWADARRAELNPRLARQTADWLDRRAEAARAFGRAEALGRIAAAAKPKSPKG